MRYSFIVLAILVLGCVQTAQTDPKEEDYSMKQATIETSQGVITIEFFPDEAPNHVKNFAKLANSGFYDGTLFHRLIPGFMIQGGDPNTRDGPRDTWGTGGPDGNVNAEFNFRSHVRGIVSMARAQDPNSAGSQFFIVVKDSKFLDRQYTVFGKVTSGMDVADKIVGLRTDPNDAPVDHENARIIKIRVADKK